MLEGSILSQLVCDRAKRGTTPLNYGVYYKNTLVALCHALEDCNFNHPGNLTPGDNGLSAGESGICRKPIATVKLPKRQTI